MKIKQINLGNFRCFEQLTIHFNPQVNVLIGDNASGKTAVLEAISELIAPFFSQMISAQTVGEEWGWHLEKNVRRVINSDNKEYMLPFQQVLHFTNEISSSYQIAHITTHQSGIVESKLDTKGEIQLKSFAAHLKQKITQKENFPIITYYSTARLWNRKDNEDKGHKANGSRLEGYLNALPVNAATFSELRLRWNTLQEEERVSGNPEPALVAMKKAIMTVIPSCKNVYFSNKQETLVFQNDNDEIFPFHILSDGYRNILAIISDIAYRCYTLNPHLKENACIETEGIILIDEIDLHLHPKWQKDIIENLKNAFPNVQFILTTHSPFIIQATTKDEIIKLVHNNIEETAEDPFKLSIEEVADYIQEVPNVERSQKFREMVQDATQYFELIEQQNDATSETEIHQLKSKLDELEILYNNDPYFVALLQMERKTKFNQHIK